MEDAGSNNGERGSASEARGVERRGRQVRGRASVYPRSIFPRRQFAGAARSSLAPSRERERGRKRERERESKERTGKRERTNESDRTGEWVTPRCAHRSLVNRVSRFRRLSRSAGGGASSILSLSSPCVCAPRRSLPSTSSSGSGGMRAYQTGGRERIQFDMEVRGMRRSTYSAAAIAAPRERVSERKRVDERDDGCCIMCAQPSGRKRGRGREREDHPRPIGNLFPPLEVEPRPIGGFGSAILSLRASKPHRLHARAFLSPSPQLSLSPSPPLSLTFSLSVPLQLLSTPLTFLSWLYPPFFLSYSHCCKAAAGSAIASNTLSLSSRSLSR